MTLLINTIIQFINKTIKMNPIDLTDDSYAQYNEDFNKKRS